MAKTLELTAKVCEKDEQKRNDLLEALSFYPIGIITVDDQIEVNFTGGEKEADIFAQLMRICEAYECHMFHFHQS